MSLPSKTTTLSQNSVLKAAAADAALAGGQGPWYWKGGKLRSEDRPEGFATMPKKVGLAIVRLQQAVRCNTRG